MALFQISEPEAPAPAPERKRAIGIDLGTTNSATDQAGARSLVEDIRLAVQGLRVPGADGRSVRVIVSSGIAVGTPDAEVTAEALFCQADTALFAAKRAGRNRVVVVGENGVVCKCTDCLGYMDARKLA